MNEWPRFANPEVLLLLAAVPWTWWLATRIHSLGGLRKATAVTLRTIILLCVIFALAGAEFGLIVGEPAEFRFFGSSVRRSDQPGTVVDGWEAGEIEELVPLEATLDAAGEEGRTVPVRLAAHVTELGTLELWCVARDGRRWKVEFNVRQAG